MGTLTLEWGDPSPTDEFFGAPTVAQLEDALLHIFEHIGPGVFYDDHIITYTSGPPARIPVQGRPSAGELAATLANLRDQVGDDENDYAINFGRYGLIEFEGGSDYYSEAILREILTYAPEEWVVTRFGEGGEPSPTELRALLVAIHASV